MPSKQSDIVSQFIRPSSSLSYTPNTDCILKYLLEINQIKGIEYNAGSFKVLGAIGTLSFGKSCKCMTATVAEWLDRCFKYLTSGVGALQNATARVDASH
jgi:hypothetical protein